MLLLINFMHEIKHFLISLCMSSYAKRTGNGEAGVEIPGCQLADTWMRKLSEKVINLFALLMKRRECYIH